jgi:hypothetical protein
LIKRIFILLFFSLSALSAQSQTDSLEILRFPYTNNLSTHFDKLLNTFSLGTRLYLLHEIDNLTFNINENYSSTFIRSTEKSVRDEQHLFLSAAYRFNTFLRTGIFGNNTILSDNRRIEINQASISNAAFFVQITPMDRLDLTPFAGYSNNRQVGENDNGLIYGGEGLLNNYKLSDFFLTSTLKFKNEDISPRRNLARSYKLRVNNNFEQNVFNFIDFDYALNRKDFYYEADSLIAGLYDVDNNIQSRTETIFVLQDRLQYFNNSNSFSVELLGRVSNRIIDRDTRYKPAEVLSASVFDTKIFENKIEFEGVSNFRTSIFSGSVRGSISERDEKHQTKNFTGVNNPFFEERGRIESQKNNISSRATAALLGSIAISKNDVFYFSVLQNKLKYDTPNENNFDDRDELLTIIRLRYTRKLSPFFEAFLNTDGTQSHTVYIFSEKSSNNNINRILRFSAGGDYRGKNFSSLNSFEVSANYTVYDFEDLNPNYQSFSFRQFTASDSTSLKLNRLLSVSFFGYLKLSEQGDLRWASFSTRPTRYLEELYGEPKIHLTYSKTIFSLGLRFFTLNTYDYNKKVRIINSRYSSTGPLAEILYLVEDRIHLKIYGWYEFIKTTGSAVREQANFNLQMTWNI